MLTLTPPSTREKSVPYLEWTPAYSVGHEEIDRQHQVLFDYVNAFHDALEDGVEQDLLVQIFAQVLEYTRFHFRDEEALMAQYAYPDLQRHKQLHQRLVETVMELQESLCAGEENAGPRVMGFLKNWLQAHVLGVDKKYRPYLSVD